MSGLATQEVSVYQGFEASASEESSDDGSISHSDAEPEQQSSDNDSDEDRESTTEAASTSQTFCGRNWCKTGPKYGKSTDVSRKQSLTAESENVDTIADCFNLFFDNRIIETVLFFTNKKARENVADKTWKPLERTELKAFFGLVLLIGRYRESRECKADLWKQSEGLSRRYYTAVMSRDRFTKILRYLRFDDSTTRDQRKEDKLAPIREITTAFTENCQKSYNASGTGCVDEQLVTFRGRCSFKVYMPNKPGKYGIRIWSLCDSRIYYCCNMDVYLGKRGNHPEKKQGQRVVKQLTEMWNNSGRCVTTDNFFTDISLAEELVEKSIMLVGTQRKNRKDLPKSLINSQARQHSSDYLFTENIALVSYVPKPRKSVVLLSTLHHERSISTEENNFKPEIVQYYNETKSGVDTLDKLVREYTCRRCTRRWPLSLFLHYIDIGAYNAFVIWNTKTLLGKIGTQCE